MSKVQIEIAIGIIMVLITGVVLVAYGLNENQRMEEFTLAQNAHAVEVGAGLYENNCAGCHGPQGQGIPGLCPPLNDRNFFDNRIKEVGWGGTVDDYIVSTIAAGRLVSTRPEYPGGGKPAMPAWSEAYGGPLRSDQIRDLASYIMNWELTAGQVVTSTQETAGPAAGTDITVELPQGDAARGEQLATTQGCTACHVTAPVGPAWIASGGEPGVGTHAAEHINDPGYTGQAATAEQYLFESIVNPSIYIVPNFQDQMPKNYGEILALQDVADLIAYLMTLQ